MWFSFYSFLESEKSAYFIFYHYTSRIPVWVLVLVLFVFFESYGIVSIKYLYKPIPYILFIVRTNLHRDKIIALNLPTRVFFSRSFTTRMENSLAKNCFAHSGQNMKSKTSVVNQNKNINSTMMEDISLSERWSGETSLRPQSKRRLRPSTGSAPRKFHSISGGEGRSVVDTLKDKVLTLSGGKFQKKKASVRKDQLARMVAVEFEEMED
jgi:hypothetical protein